MATAAGLALRAFMLGYMPLWRDEAFTAVLARLPLGSMLSVVAHDSGPPLHYVVIKALTLLTTSPVAVRLPSVAAGVATIPIAAALGRRAAGDRGGVLAAFSLAVLPFAIFESRDGRMYALATFFVLAGCLALWRAIEKPGMRRWLAYTGIAALGVYTQYLVAVALGAALAAAAMALRPSRMAMAQALGATCLGFVTLLPWLVFAQPQFHHAVDGFWVHPLSLAGVVNTLLAFIGGPPPPKWAQLRDLRLGIGLVALAAAATLLLRGWLKLSSPQRRGSAFLFLAGTIGVGALMAISLRRPLFESRYAGVTWPALYPLMGVVLCGLRWRPVAWVTLAVVAGLAPSGMLLQPETPDYVAVAASLNEVVEPADTIALLTPKHYFPLAYYTESEVASRLVIFDPRPPWYWGVAAIPPTALTGKPITSAGQIYAVVDRGRAGPPVASGFTWAARRCYRGVCIDTFKNSSRRLSAARRSGTPHRAPAPHRSTA